MRAAVFLDRDGVINENRLDYVKSWEEFTFLPGALVALQRLANFPYAVVVVSNQSAVGRGLLSLHGLEEIHRRMKEMVESQGGRLDDILYCPHTPDAGCGCRKPQVSLLYEATRQLDLDLNRSYMVGDSLSDIQMSVNAHCQPVLVLTGRGQEQQRRMPPQVRENCLIFPDLLAFVNWLPVG